jgi:hypothetical protein
MDSFMSMVGGYGSDDDAPGVTADGNPRATKRARKA